MYSISVNTAKWNVGDGYSINYNEFNSFDLIVQKPKM